MPEVTPQDVGLGQLFWHIRDAVVVGEATSGRVVLWNPAAELLFGYTAAEAVGLPLDALVPERLRVAHRVGLERYRATGQGRLIDGHVALEMAALRKGGAEVPVELMLTPVPAGTVPGTYVLAIIRDASLRRRAEEERTARAAAEEAVRLRDEFLSVAAHELKTPMTSLKASVQLVLRRLGEGHAVPVARHLRSLEIIDQQVTTLARLVEQLLDVSHLQQGILQLHPQTVDLMGLVEKIIAAAQLRAEQHTFVLHAPAAVAVWADPLRLEQVLVNLLDNAVKFSPPGLDVEVRVASSPDMATVAVRDHGFGIPVEKRAGLFARFYQAHAESYRSGLGLGLYLSDQIVRLHGGQIAAEFPVDGGTRMVVQLPLHRGQEAVPHWGIQRRASPGTSNVTTRFSRRSCFPRP